MNSDILLEANGDIISHTNCINNDHMQTWTISSSALAMKQRPMSTEYVSCSHISRTIGQTL